MRAWDSVTKGSSLRPGPAVLSILLAGLLLSLAPVSERIENGYYDLVQGLREAAGSPQIAIVDTRTFDQGAASIWDSPGFPGLLQSLGKAGARLVIPLDPPPVAGTLPDPAQLAALSEIARRGATDPAIAPNNAAFERRLADLRRHAELHAATLAAIGSLRNTIVTIPVFEGTQAGSAASAGGCAAQFLDTGAAAPQAPEIAMRQVRGLASLPEPLCEVVLGAGHGAFWPDADGVVRQHDLLLDATGGHVPSTALRAVLALTFPGGKPPTIEPDAISWDRHRLRTSGGTGTLMRFYPGHGGQAAFSTLTAEQLLNAPATTRQVSGRIVLLGHASLAPADTGYSTPLQERIPPALLVATALSNILENDYLVRPSWAPWLETTLMVLTGLLALLRGRQLPVMPAVLIGLCVAAAALAAEAYLLLGPGLWLRLGTVASFALVATLAMRFTHPQATMADAPQPMAAPGSAGSPAAAPGSEDELDLAFSMLRHQVPSKQVKQRLYDIALEHARRRDLAKAERVLRHLAGIDPEYRRAGEKLQKLAGMRSNPPAAAAGTAEPPAMRPVLTPAPEAAILRGQTIGRYEIEEPIGRGAMATVYLGRDPKINRRVAIKTIALAEEFTDSDLDNARTQFLREAESAGRLNHPNIISIYDAGEDGQVAYLAMEYFPGKSLSHYAQQGSLLPPRRALELIARAAEALHYAHGQHVVHRDVKPANIMYDRDTDTLKITDFGIARLTDSSRTKTGIILGTPSYMSPEQLAGTTVTGQSDLFSLGITLYQLLAGYPPFRADSIPRLMQKITHERHPPISGVRDDLPGCIDEVLDKALAKDPLERYPSGRAMAVALRNCCSKLDAAPAARSA